MKRLLCALVLSGVLVGCASTPNGADIVNANQRDVASDAYSRGVGGESGFDGDELRSSASLRAPQNQTYYFGFDSNAVSMRDNPAIDAQANYLASHPRVKVRLEGNTDERGSREYNIALGWRRAKSVARVMEQEGVSPRQLVMVSFGQERPAVPGHDESSYEKNRRVNLVYLR